MDVQKINYMHKLAIFLLFSCSVIAQKNIRVEYTAQVNPLEKKSNFDRLQQALDYAVENDDNFRFELLISSKQARFTNISVMPSSESIEQYCLELYRLCW